MSAALGRRPLVHWLEGNRHPPVPNDPVLCLVEPIAVEQVHQITAFGAESDPLVAVPVVFGVHWFTTPIPNASTTSYSRPRFSAGGQSQRARRV